MRRILLGGLIVVVLVVGAALAVMTFLPPSAPERRPALADIPPLKPVTRTSVVIAPAAIALTAIRDALEAQAPRDLSGKSENPVGQLLQNAELVRSFSRTGAPYAARISLGPAPVRISSGTVAAAEITVRERRPVSLILPLLRSGTGIGT